jgi:hypothetical protein
MADAFRHILKAHIKAHYRHLAGKVIYVPDHDDKRPQGRTASLHERTEVGVHKDGTAYLRATDSDDARAIQEAAAKHGISMEKRRRGATHHGRLGAYDHFHVGDLSEASKVMTELGGHHPSPPASRSEGPHTAESVASYGQGGYGYFGHEHYHPSMNAAVAEAANHHGLTSHQVKDFLQRQSGRWALDGLRTHLLEPRGENDLPSFERAEIDPEVGKKVLGSIPHEEKVRHFKDWMNPKGRIWKKLGPRAEPDPVESNESPMIQKGLPTAVPTPQQALTHLHHATVALNGARLEPRNVTKALHNLEEALAFRDAVRTARSASCSPEDLQRTVSNACGGITASEIFKALMEPEPPAEGETSSEPESDSTSEA